MMMNNDELKRCNWGTTDPLYVAYHDREWGCEVNDDQTMFEFLVLESSQAGLSWITILRKRENYRKAFAEFHADEVAAFTDRDVERLMQDAGIVRNRRKIEATITNAQCFLKVQDEFGSCCSYLRSFLPDGKPVVNRWKTLAEIPASTPLSDAISRDMKNRGFKFFGTTICYAHLQATGYVNDHMIDCFCHPAHQQT
jgi:DNA-3-methyladenine glycosylase I